MHLGMAQLVNACALTESDDAGLRDLAFLRYAMDRVTRNTRGTTI